MIKKITTTLICTLFSTFMLAQSQQDISTITKQLQKDGWHRKEIDHILSFVTESPSGLKSKKDEDFKPLPKPNLEHLKNIQDLEKWVDSYTKSYESFTKEFSEANKTYSTIGSEKVFRNKKINRDRGLWKHIEMYATSGRIYDLELNPSNPDVMYANPDGDGIFITKDGGLHWNCITDNIPNRLDRNSYENIIVDPSNFDVVFSVSSFGNMYKTDNAGNTWEKVVNKDNEVVKAPQFKWVEAFRDKEGKRIIIGSVTKQYGLNPGWEKGIYRTENDGKVWTKLNIDGQNFQELAFHKRDRNIVYLASNDSFYKSTDAGKTFKLIKNFKYGNRPMFITTLSGDNADGVYVAISKGDFTKVYYSGNQGKSWELRQDSENKIGYEKGIFGQNGSSGWTSFFEVDPFDKNHLIASSVGSCESFDGGVTWEYQKWWARANAQMLDGSKPLTPFGSHNADNHVIKFHPLKKGLRVKGCDSGILKKEIADTNWVNINGDMPAFLWYSIVVNEFGDRYISGNTQDVNIQTYRYNKWENDRGYEGDVIYMNPATNTTYYATAETEPGEGLGFLEPGFWKMHSWNYPKATVDYTNMDHMFIAFGRRPTEPEPQLPKYLYETFNRGVSFTRVKNLDRRVYAVNYSRTEDPVLTTLTDDGVYKTRDGGETWKINKYPDYFKVVRSTRGVGGSIDPKNPNRIWVGGDNGMIISTVDGGETWKNIKGSLPNSAVLELLFHEGTKEDLYALVKGYGVFYKNDNSKDWKLWMDGFNLASFNEIRIDYPAQKLLAASYGRGAWVADLEKSVDRFYTEDNLKIKSKGRVNGKYVFELDTKYTTPDYYRYTWYRNGEKVGIDSRRLILDRVKKRDEIRVEISPYYSVDVVTSAKLIVDKSSKIKLIESDGYLHVDGKYLDAGYVDLFGANQNFTFSTWIRPITPGIIAANRRAYFKDAKGWYLEIGENGKLKFNLAYLQNRSLEKTFNKGKDQSITIESKEGVVGLNKWIHVAVAVNRLGSIDILLDGVVVATKQISEIDPSLSLNHVFNLTLMADSYGRHNMFGDIKCVAINTKALSEKEIKSIIKRGYRKSDKLNMFIQFDDNINSVKEQYSGMRIVEKEIVPIPVKKKDN